MAWHMLVPKTLYVADYEDCRDADLVVITAGAPLATYMKHDWI